MKSTLLLTLAFSAAASGTAWAQNAAPAAQGGSSDPIVQMHMQIDAARHVYDRKVAAAQKVFDQKKAAAAKERDAAIAQARYGAGQAGQQ
jgi:hypothetical protein